MADLFDLEPEQETPQQKGGKARANRLSPEQKSEIARNAANSRWAENTPVFKATHGSADRPLIIGNQSIPCYVLEDGRRVLSQGGMFIALGISHGGGGSQSGGDRLSRFVGSNSINPFISNELLSRIKTPIRFVSPTGGSLGNGYEATILPEICDAILESRKAKRLKPQQSHIAEQAEILVRGLARVGIIALVDEATGYQEVRDRKALEEILNKYISEELRKWTSTFPSDYFTQVFRLKNWKSPSFPSARPGVFAHYTKDIVYARLAPGVLEELQRLNPTDGQGRRKHKLFQHLTEDHGHPKLKEHLKDVVTLMKASTTWNEFRKLLDRVKPLVNAPDELQLNSSHDD